MQCVTAVYLLSIPLAGFRDTVFDSEGPDSQTGYHMVDQHMDSIQCDVLAAPTARVLKNGHIQLNGLNYDSRWRNSGLAIWRATENY